MNLKNTQSHTKFPFIWLKNLQLDKQEKQTLSFKICILLLSGLCPHSSHTLPLPAMRLADPQNNNCNWKHKQLATVDMDRHDQGAKYSKV
jgi:hypothetical protein